MADGPTSMHKKMLRPSHPDYLSLLIFIAIVAIVLVLVCCSSGTASAVPTLKDTNLMVETVTTGLSSPTSMAFLAPNDVLVLEKNKGTVQRIKNGNLLSQPLLDVNVATNSERGMLGIDIVKISANIYYVFLYYTEAQSADGGTAIANRLYRYIFVNDPSAGPTQGIMICPKLLLDLPVTPGPNHNGGKVFVGPGGSVHLITGDLNRQTKAQNFEVGPDPDGTSGILRVTQEGATVGAGVLGNSHPIDKYVAYGVRNSFGIDYDPVTGRAWDTENGPASNDEINLAELGFNSGWRDIMGMAPAGFDFNNLVDFDGKGKYSDPEFVWTQTVAPTAIEFLSSNKLGASYQYDMFVSDFNKGRIYRFDLNAQRSGLILTGVLADKIANTDSETQSIIFGEGFGGITDLKVGPGDGYLYLLSFTNGAIYKILPKITTTADTISADTDYTASRDIQRSGNIVPEDNENDSTTSIKSEEVRTLERQELQEDSRANGG
jgi:glucose/arabinose dehydrogenase